MNMHFDSHRGWVSNNPNFNNFSCVSRPRRKAPAKPLKTWGTNDRGHIWGEIADADYYRLIDAGRHGDKTAIAELQRRDALKTPA